MKRRELIGMGTLGLMDTSRPTSKPPGSKSRSSDLEWLSIAELQARMQAGKLSSRSLTKKYLQRIEELDRSGPKLRSVLEINPDALALAEVLDKERKKKGPRGPLHGIPILIKDNIDTADRMTTTAGSRALEGWTPPEDAHLVKRLREAGAVILGKANLSEWANFRSNRSSSGWSGRGGQTKNPHVLDRNPSGSSSGSGAAVAAGLCAAAVGTETDGSIVSPANACGVVGIKPTLGMISRTGVIPIAHSQDTAGPMARTVADAAFLLAGMAGPDPRDPATAEAGSHPLGDVTRLLDKEALKGARLGVARQFFGERWVDPVMEKNLQALKKAGAVLIDIAEIPNLNAYGSTERLVLLYEFKADLNAYLERLPSQFPRTLKELIAFNQGDKTLSMPFFDQEIFHEAEAKGPLTEKAYLDALAANHRQSRTEGLDVVFKEHRLDALIAPTGGPAGVTDLIYRGTGGGKSPSSLAAVSGYPHITVPAGEVFGLPVGLSFIGPAWSDGRLISLAYAFEQATHARREPRFAPAVEI